MTRDAIRRVAVMGVSLGLLGGRIARAQSPQSLADVLPRGAVVEHLTSRANPRASYALYLPSNYSSERKWPIVFLLDPRGRAGVPLDLFQRAAERLGYILLSSYDTRSDGPREPNDMAMDAMLADVQRYLAIDGRRLYLAGFSGTARFAWDISEQLPGALAGIIGFGAALPGDPSWLAQHVRGSPFAFFGAVGAEDPNYEEVRDLGRALGGTTLPFEVTTFAGGHRWPPESTCAHALAWLSLQAMRKGLAPHDSTLVDSLGRSATTEAQAMEATGEPFVAWRAWRAYTAVFPGLRDITVGQSRVAALGATNAVRDGLRRESELRAPDLEWTRALFDVLRDLRVAESPPGVGEMRGRARLDDVARAAKSTDAATRALGERAVNRVVTYATFYELRDYFAQKRWERAAALLQLARRVAPDDGGVCFGLARALAQLGKEREALAALSCAAKGDLTAEALDQSPLLAPLRSATRYAEIVSELRARARARQ